MANFDFKVATPATLTTAGFLFGATSQGAATPSILTTTFTGTGSLVCGTAPSLTTPALGVATATSVTASGLLQAGTTLGISTDVLLNRDAANTLALRNSTNAQKFHVYTTYTDASNYECLKFDSFSGTSRIYTEASGTGSSRGLNILAAGSLLGLGASSSVTWYITTTDLAAASDLCRLVLGASSDVILRRAAAASLQLGAADAASPVAQTLQVQSVVTGTADTAGGNWTLKASKSTGAGTPGDIIFQTSGKGAASTTVNTLITALTIKGGTTNNTNVGQPSVVIGNAAIATNATDGFLYIPTCAGTPTGTPTTFTGRVALVYDTSNSQFWIYSGGTWLQPKTPAAAALVTWQ